MNKPIAPPQDLIGSEDSSRLLDALRRGATRRDLLAMLMGGGMQVALATTAAGWATTAQAETPRRGGRLRVAGASSSINDTLDPARQASQSDYIRCNMFYNGLTVLDNALVAQPALAESFSHQKATLWTFKLRKGVQFHDGRALTPADVVFSLNRHKDPAVASRAKTLADEIEEVRQSGPNEVQVRLKTANADFPAILGTYHFKVVPDGTTDFSKGIGTGPFKCKEFKPGGRSLAVRNESYWRPDRPYLDEIEYVGIGDESARVNALLSGGLDLVAAVDPRSSQRIGQTPGYGVFVAPSGQYSDLVMRRDNGPGSNPDFVLAMKHLFNREQMRKSIALGNAAIGNDQPIDPTNRYFNAALPQRAFDLDKAKFHLRKSGLGSGAIPIVASPAATYSVEMALVLQQTARQIGLNLEVKRMPADGYWSNHWMKSPIGFGNTNPRATADILFTQFFKSDATWNESGWKSEQFDQLLLAARGEADEARRKSLYGDMQVLVHEQGGVGIPLFISSLDAHSSKVRGFVPMPLGGMMGTAFAEHLWLAA
ncbi:ABC transporter substrate-binding protein [Ideonella azotifigens]|uniref:ABC transporter substrate-binding protein n=2 Tax=Ideonella azotifigens TaxID=513160 RepID=A0ABN1K654_9BURK